MIWGGISLYVNGENVLGGVAYKNEYKDTLWYGLTCIGFLMVMLEGYRLVNSLLHISSLCLCLLLQIRAITGGGKGNWMEFPNGMWYSMYFIVIVYESV